MTRTRSLLAGAAVVTTLLGGAVAAAPAGADAALSVSSTILSSDGPSTVTVTGRGYLVPPHLAGSPVFGGVYVLFGWVRPGVGWGPSSRNAVNSDGQFGLTYHYPGEGGTGDLRDDGTGTNRFVAFTPGGIDASSTPFHMDDAGNWSVTLNISGPLYRWTDPFTGTSASVDCRSVQCGVLTIGAHGRPSQTNERFVPLTFAPSPAGPGPTAAPPVATVPPVAVEGATAVPPSTRPRSPVAGAPIEETTTTSVTPAIEIPTSSTTTVTTTTSVRSGDDRRERSTASPASRRDVIRITSVDDGLLGTAVPYVVAGIGVPAAAGLFLVVRARRSSRPV
ncbi:MAG: hypothetical protein U0Q22_18445 [Acidimicrobiales bacterium]